MGKITTTGYASRFAEADRMALTIEFESEAKSTATAIKRMRKHCETFLAAMADYGCPPEELEISAESTGEYSWKKGKSYYARRKIVWEVPFDMRRSNAVMDIIRTHKIEADLRTHYIISKRTDLEADLLADAVRDSRRRAEIIAAAGGGEIKGIDRVVDDRSSVGKVHVFYEATTNFSFNEELSDRLAAPFDEISTEIQITWKVK